MYFGVTVLFDVIMPDPSLEGIMGMPQGVQDLGSQQIIL